MLKDIKIKKTFGKTIFVGKFKNIKDAVNYCSVLKVDLRDVDLRGADLRGADLRGADLTDANLRGANLTCANLTCANLTDANLTCANLTDANLRGANLTDANLRGANLTCANLTDANLTCADLTDANLRGANLDFASVSLRCSSTKMIVCDRFIGQIAYHLTRVDYSNCSDDVKKELERIKKGPLGNLFSKYRNDLIKV